MKKLLTILLLLLLVSCSDTPQSCVKQSMYIDFDYNRPTGVTVEQAMKICGIK